MVSFFYAVFLLEYFLYSEDVKAKISGQFLFYRKIISGFIKNHINEALCADAHFCNGSGTFIYSKRGV